MDGEGYSGQERRAYDMGRLETTVENIANILNTVVSKQDQMMGALNTTNNSVLKLAGTVDQVKTETKAATKWIKNYEDGRVKRFAKLLALISFTGGTSATATASAATPGGLGQIIKQLSGYIGLGG